MKETDAIGAIAAEDTMFDDDDPDTLPNLQLEGELLEAVEWLRNQGFLSGEDRPFATLLTDAAPSR